MTYYNINITLYGKRKGMQIILIDQIDNFTSFYCNNL